MRENLCIVFYFERSMAPAVFIVYVESLDLFSRLCFMIVFCFLILEKIHLPSFLDPSLNFYRPEEDSVPNR